MSSPFDDLSCLDDLITPVYHRNHRLVLLSNVRRNEWVLHLGMKGSEGRWWRGGWQEADVWAFAGSEASSEKLQDTAEKLLENIRKEEIFVSGWSPESNTKLKLVLGDPDADKRCVIHLNEMSPQDAASYATEVFLNIAMDAQSRKCQLFGISGIPAEGSSFLNAISSSSQIALNQDNEASSSRKRHESQKAAEQPVPSKKRKERKEESPKRETKPMPKTVQKPLKGASLANPTKKARKYQAVQFESDED
ncbi:hypothetical protein GYMLUDRAFT_188280 [Collybiopsis luxurians FD-317 M1]|nr:hypothetical protein GYMLUDRAFT_188280 [Collybiopsis luxurians FD-317 M1]